jgi:hypothetical protein
MLTINIPIVLFIGVLAVVVCSIYFFNSILNFLKHQRIITSFADYSSVLQYYMDKAYDMVHKDRILIYSLEATKIPENEINAVSIDFIHLTEKMLGPRLRKEFIFLHGNYETFAFIMAEYFSTRYEHDEIRKSSVDEMMESESQSET